MRASTALLFFIGLILLSVPTASAFTFGPLQHPFAFTRSETVQWATNATIETNVLLVKANSIQIGSTDMNLEAYAGRVVKVTIETWSIDVRTFTVTMITGTSTGLNLTYSNPGYNLTVVEAGVPTHTCAEVISTCSWTFPLASTTKFSVVTPAGSGAVSHPPDVPGTITPGSGGGGAPADTGRTMLPSLPNPIALFPTFSAQRWAFLAVGGVLTFSSIPRTRTILPPIFRLPGQRQFLLFAGIAIIVLVYLTTPIPK